MKKLLAKIRKILRDRRTRQLLTRIVSITAAVVVFITTYALVLPAITMESEANCGIPAHQHDDSCYEDRLICGRVESPGHQHTDACYSLSQSLICTETEHQHDDSCFDADGNLTCEMAEHTHDDSCYEEVRELVCSIPESEGHEHTDDCYERILACGMEAHTHSTACYSHGSELTSSAPSDFAAVATTELGSYGATVSASAETDTNSEETSNTWASDESAAGGLSSTAAGAAATDYSSTATAADTASTGFDAATAEDAFVPQLEPIIFEQLLTKDTGIYYYHAEEGEEVPENSVDIADWKRVNDDTELAPADLLRVYLRYTIPAGALNATNDIARYRLPSNLHLTDQQMEAINTTVNGIANQYVNLDTLEITDTERYNTYLGIEATEGTRKPSDDIDEYFTNHPDMEAQEFINAVVRAENVFDETTEEYLGQDLVFTFTPYTVQENQHEYDAEGQPTKAGQKVNGWLCFDLHMDQIDWSEPVISTIEDPAAPAQDVATENTEDTYSSDTTEATEKVASDMDEDASLSSSNPYELNTNTITEKKESSAEIVFAAKDEIRTEIHLVEFNTIEKENDAAQDEPDQSADESTDNANSEMTDGKDDIADDSNPEGEADKPESANEPATDTENQPESAMEINAETYPAVSFEDTITVQAGTLSTDNENAAKDTLAETAITVSVIAEEETFPLGTTMQLGTVEDMDTVASAVEGAVEGQTRGFHAVDISFHNAYGEEIEPLKPIKVSMTSDAIKQAVEDSSTAPVVVHVENPINSEKDTAFEGSKDSTDLTENTTDASKNSADADAKSDRKAEAGENTPVATIVEANETTASEPSNETKEKADTLSFDAGSFSVYAIVYTVDFHWEVDGKMYEFSIPGGGYLSLEQLIEVLGIRQSTYLSDSEPETTPESDEIDSASYEKKASDSDNSCIILSDIDISDTTRKFVAEVEKVEFSSPDLVWIGKIDEDVTVGEIKDKYKLECEYSYRLTWDEIQQINASVVKKDDWAIISLQAFQTEEMLRITMKDGSVFNIKVTDYAQYTPVENDGVTIPNPNGTTINMFDYWVDNSLKNNTGKLAWPGYNGSSYTTTWHNGQELMGDGNNSGINSWAGNSNEGHALKFNPSDHHTVIDGNYNNNWSTRSENGSPRINSWQGDADPLQGLVEPTLNANGYPKLTNNSNLGTNGEDLNYLFDGTEGDNMGKKVYPGVNGLLYVDRDGYYTYDSRDFTATYNSGSKNFTLAPQTAGEGTGPRGFWPFGSEKFWFGMHLKVDFSMPANGKVLNPAGVYKDMTFSFSGDDDTWIYVDGILVGDGGGVHNRTQIDVNFRAGTVYVTGKNDPSYTGSFEKTTYLEDYYRAAGRFDASQWTEVKDDSGNTVYRTENGQQRPVLTFKDGSGHDLQMFYMERGGGFSNLMIHYNLVSTTDFSAHKSYHNSNGSILRRNDYKFELVGYDNPEYASDGEEFVKAIMPDAVTYDSSKPLGTFENPLWQTVAASGTTGGYRSVTIGNTEDGNVNFGNKEISSAYAGKQYKYMVREIVPDNAVNPDGVRWADASEDLREEGGFVLNGITYDSRVYYYIGKVVEEPAGSGKYTLKKERYLDPECTIPDTETKFFSFVNGEERPLTFKVIKKSDTNALLDGAVFSLTRAMEHHHDNKWVVREYTLNNVAQHSAPVTATSSQGVLTFPNLVEGHYILEELAAPSGYAMGMTHRWLLTLQKEDSADKILLVPYITPLDEEGRPTGARVALDMPDANNTFEYEVLNGPLPPIDLSLEKKWNDNGDTSVPDGAEATFELHRIRAISPVKVELLDKNGNKLSEVSAFVGDVIKIYDSGEEAFKHYIPTPAWWALQQGNTRSASDIVNLSDSGWTISTNNQYSVGAYGAVNLVSSTTASNGQYTVKQSDVTAGVIQLKLNNTYQGGTNNDRFDKTPVLYVSNSIVNSTSVDDTIATFTLKELNGDGDPGNAWKKSFEDLPVVDTDGHPYTYYFREVSHSPSEYNIQNITGNMGTASSPLSTDSAVVVTNNTPNKPKIIASKAWKDSAGNAITDETGLQELEVKLTLFKGTNLATSDDTKNAITQTVTGNGEATWMLKDPNADVSQYSVKETAVKIPGGDFVEITSDNPFGGTVTGDSTNGYTITNQLPTTEIAVTKQWKDGTSTNADRVFDEAKTISFALYQKLGDNGGSMYLSAGQAVTGTVTYTPASGGTAASWSTETIQNLPKYVYSDGSWIEATYYPVETGDMSNVRITYQKSGGDATESPDAAAVSSGTVTIINTDIVVPLKIVKVDAKSKAGLSGAKFKLTRKLSGEGSFTNFVHSSFEEDPENGNKKTGPFTVSSADGIVLEGLLPGEYRIEEKQAPKGYIISLQPFTFTINANGTVSSADADGTLVLHLEKSGSDPEGYQISNEPGAALPNTGGPGTLRFYIMGFLILSFAAGYRMICRRRTTR